MHIKLIGYSIPHMRLAVITHGDGDKCDHYGEHGHIMQRVHKRAKDYPATWREHLAKPGGHMEIVAMEYSELMTQRSGGTREGVEKELTDLAAACICALKHMRGDE